MGADVGRSGVVKSKKSEGGINRCRPCVIKSWEACSKTQQT